MKTRWLVPQVCTMDQHYRTTSALTAKSVTLCTGTDHPDCTSVRLLGFCASLQAARHFRT